MSETLASVERAKAAELIVVIDERIDRQLTPPVLSRLAFKGITPDAARDYLRVRALQGLAEATQ